MTARDFLQKVGERIPSIVRIYVHFWAMLIAPAYFVGYHLAGIRNNLDAAIISILFILANVSFDTAIIGFLSPIANIFPEVGGRFTPEDLMHALYATQLIMLTGILVRVYKDTRGLPSEDASEGFIRRYSDVALFVSGVLVAVTINHLVNQGQWSASGYWMMFVSELKEATPEQQEAVNQVLAELFEGNAQ